jgi:beta-mannosidase
MPSYQSWKEVYPEADIETMESHGPVHRNRHYPFGATGDPVALSLTGIAEMTAAVQLWYPVPNKSDAVANFRSVRCKLLV